MQDIKAAILGKEKDPISMALRQPLQRPKLPDLDGYTVMANESGRYLTDENKNLFVEE